MINKQQHWKLKYFEKNKHESHINIFKSLEIESYLKQHFKRYGLNLHSYKINFLATKIIIYLTINENTRTQDEKKKWKQLSMKLFIEQKDKKTEKSICPLCLNEINERSIVKIYQNILKAKRTFKNGTVKIISDQKLQLVHKHCYENDVKEKNFKRLIKKIDILPPFNNKTNTSLQQSPPTSKKKVEKQQPDTIKTLPSFTLIHEPYSKQKFANNKPNYQRIPKNFFKNLLKNLKRFTKNKSSIVLKTKQINEEFFQGNIKLSFLGIENKFTIPEMRLLYLILLTQKNSADLLSTFIAKQLKKTKRHNFFLNILFQNLTLIMNQKRSKIKGIKILFKGRLNNAPRSQNKTIKLGKIPLINQNIDNDYSESISVTPNGTIGIKIWINQVKNYTQMFLQPKKTKYKKVKKGKLKKLEFKKNKLKFGTIGLKAVDSAIINARHIEASRQAISRKIKRKGKLWIRIFPDLPITAKSLSSRMGKGKGAVSHWGARIKSGSILFEICGIKDLKIVKSALKTGGAKLPIRTKIFS